VGGAEVHARVLLEDDGLSAALIALHSRQKCKLLI
jgi:hypothetical protein